MLSSRGTGIPDMLAAMLVIALVTGPLLLLSLVLARTVPSTITFLGATMAGLVTLVMISLIAEILFKPDGGASTQWSDLAEPAVILLVLTTVGMLVLCAPWLAVRMVFGRPVPDDPRLCARCNYEYGAPGATCPECGVAREPRAFRRRFALATSAFCHRWGWTLALGFGLVVLAVFTWRAAQVTRPALAWSWAIQGSQPVPPWLASAWSGRMPLSNQSAVWLPRQGRGNGGHGIVLIASIESGRITRAELTTGVGSATGRLMVTLGNARISATLDARQAQHILDHGLPPCVIDAMYREADGRGWSPQSSASSADRPEFPVDLSACFQSPSSSN
jgi:hypothetical protein